VDKFPGFDRFERLSLFAARDLPLARGVCWELARYVPYICRFFPERRGDSAGLACLLWPGAGHYAAQRRATTG